jgi:hypothetical protein
MPVNSELHQFLVETHRIVEFEPAILHRIESDLDAYGLKKKVLREADRRFLEGQTPDLAQLRIELRQIDPTKLELEIGRPRLEPYMVYLFLMLRGRLGVQRSGRTTLAGRTVTLHWWLENLGLNLPPASTSENLNAVSNATRDFIHRAQLRYILREELDDFSSLYLDKRDPSQYGTSDRLRLNHKLVERSVAGQQVGSVWFAQHNPSGLEELQQNMRDASGDWISTGKAKSQAKLKSSTIACCAEDDGCANVLSASWGRQKALSLQMNCCPVKDRWRGRCSMLRGYFCHRQVAAAAERRILGRKKCRAAKRWSVATGMASS